MEILNIISDNIVVFMILIIILIINFCCIIFLIVRERKEDKKEIKELLDELKPKEETVNTELEAKQDKKLEENKKEVEEMLMKMQKDLEAKPEDAVNTFENEQEEKSIISYQELLESVKNNNEVKVTPVKIETEKIEIEEEPKEEKIEVDIKPELKKELKEEIDEINMEDTVLIEPTVKEEDNSKKFKGTEFISPIFGRVENNVKYPTVPKRMTRMDNLMVEKEEKYDKIEESKLNLVDTQKLDDDLRKNDDFLKALKEFRKSLD